MPQDIPSWLLNLQRRRAFGGRENERENIQRKRKRAKVVGEVNQKGGEWALYIAKKKDIYRKKMERRKGFWEVGVVVQMPKIQVHYINFLQNLPHFKS